MQLQNLKTPALVLDINRVKRNAENMTNRIKGFGAILRPHIKTHKCIEIAQIQTAGHFGGLTVSTLAEARAFVSKGFRDITYAVPIEPGKFVEACEISRDCERFAVITDDSTVPGLLNETAKRSNVKLDVFLKVDCGYHRCGVEIDSPEAFEIPRLITDSSNLIFAGILTHAGHSYNVRSKEDLLVIARYERDLMKEFASALKAKSIEVPCISIGSTPTLSCVDHLDGIDEARPGNYIFYDAFQATLGSCRFDDCALTVLSAVIHRDSIRRKIVVDAGAIALSKDLGAIKTDPHCGYGRVLDLSGTDLNLRVDSLSQEHGIIKVEDEEVFDRLTVGDRVRILANHSCLTAAQHSHYNILEGEHIVDHWAIERGW